MTDAMSLKRAKPLKPRGAVTGLATPHRRWAWAGLTLGAAALLVGCSSTPLRFYTLVPPVSAAVSAPLAPVAPTAEAPVFELLAVSVPARMDIPQLRVRAGAADLRLLEGHQWASPLPEEIRDAIARRLVERHGARDLRRQPGPTHPQRVTLRVDIQRFEVDAAGHQQVDALWTVLRDGEAIRCESRIARQAGPSPEEWVIGYQQALVEIADAMGRVITGSGACS